MQLKVPKLEIIVDKIAQFNNENGQGTMVRVQIYPEKYLGDSVTIGLQLPYSPDATLAEIEKEAKNAALQKLRKTVEQLESM